MSPTVPVPPPCNSIEELSETIVLYKSINILRESPYLLQENSIDPNFKLDIDSKIAILPFRNILEAIS
jgi:hypothetical protein